MLIWLRLYQYHSCSLLPPLRHLFLPAQYVHLLRAGPAPAPAPALADEGHSMALLTRYGYVFVRPASTPTCLLLRSSPSPALHNITPNATSPSPPRMVASY